MRRSLPHSSFIDPLSGLPNRTLLLDRIAELSPPTGTATEPPRLAVMVVDLAGFGRINREEGREIGDRIVVAAARRLQRLATDERVLANLGGDRFALLVPLRAGEDPHALGAAARAALADPAEEPGGVAGRPLDAYVGVAVGAVAHAAAAASLLGLGEAAAERAKLQGRGAVEVLDRAQPEDQRRAQLLADLEPAIESGAVGLVFQPIVDLRSGRTRALEALLRWRHPQLGPIGPAEFVPLAEQAGLMSRLGPYSLRRGAEAVMAYNARNPARRVDLVINLAGVRLADPELPAQIRDSLTATGLSPHQLILDVQERGLTEYGTIAATQLPALTAMGVRLALDDFGTGLSSLSLLDRFPFDILKIDRSLVAGLERDGAEATLVRAALGLAGGLGLHVIAEGVETETQADLLRHLGCPSAQGFLFARPSEPERLRRAITSAERADPERERDRVQSLLTYNILDTPPEQVFDDLARIAAEVCGTRAGFINLIDDMRQWTKASFGDTVAPLPRRDSFCSVALETPGRTMVVTDATLDARFAENPLVQDGLRFYAGAPLVNRQGYALGTLCVSDEEPRELTPQQHQALNALARLVVDQLEVRRQARSLEAESEARRRAEERLVAILEQAPDAYVAMNPRGEISEWNTRARQLLGWDRSEVIGRRADELFLPEEEHANQRARIADLAEAGGPGATASPVTFDAIRRDGSTVPVEMTLSTVVERGEQVVTGFLRDISERRLADAEEARVLSELQAMSELGRSLSLAADEDDVGHAVVRAAVEINGGEAVALLMLRAPGDDAMYVVTASEPALVGESIALRGERSLSVRALRSGQPEFNPDAAGDGEFSHRLAAHASVRSAAAHPISLPGEDPLGVLVVGWSDPRERMPERLAPLLGVIALDAAVAIDRVRLLERLSHAAATDPLTKLWNRSVWARDLPRELSRAQREGSAVSVALLDLDHFKDYNDSHGHQAGDELLVEAAAVWSEQIRATDVLARYGGEEFALLLPSCPEDAAVGMLQRLAAGTPGGQTCSVGVAEWDRRETPDELLRRADLALYAAKAGGRNQVIAASTLLVDGTRTRRRHAE